MAVEFADGVVIGADSRTSTGSYVANRVTDKLTKISDKIYCCRSGQQLIHKQLLILYHIHSISMSM
jgi:20S proteasome subunit beta 1